jgi:hypothetical protein
MRPCYTNFISKLEGIPTMLNINFELAETFNGSKLMRSLNKSHRKHLALDG